MTATTRHAASTPAFLAAALLLFTVLTAAMTFPQLLHMRDGVSDEGDPLLVTWVFAWVAHQLPVAPAHLFDANIFYPERRTLAFSETMLAPALAVAPLHWLRVGPILIYNIVFLSGFILSGVGTALLVRSLTGHTGAAMVAGLIFAFLPYRIEHYSHLQLQQAQWIPLALWAFHSLLRTGRLRHGVLLGLLVGCQVLSCMYYGLFLIPYMAVVCGAVLLAQRTLSKQRVQALLVAGAIACAAAIPVVTAHMGARRVVGERTLQEVIDLSATWRSYLAAPATNLLYGRVLARFGQPERVLFPGFVAVALALIGLWPNPDPRTQTPEPRTRFAYALGLLLALDLSLGFNGFTYGALYDYVLPFRALRAPARMGLLVGFSLAVLAGYGVARIVEALTSRWAQRAVPVIIGALILAEYVSTPVRVTIVSRTAPSIYADLLTDRGDSPTAVIFEYPATVEDEPTYMYYSTFHWQFLVNGYSGFFPTSYVRVVQAMKTFPDDQSLEAVKAHGARYVVVHGERLMKWRDNPELLMRRLAGQSQLALVSRRPWLGSEIRLYRVLY